MLKSKNDITMNSPINASRQNEAGENLLFVCSSFFHFFYSVKNFLPAVFTIQLDHDHARALLSIEKISLSSDLSWSQFRYSVKTFFLLQILPIQLFLGTQTAL